MRRPRRWRRRGLVLLLGAWVAAAAVASACSHRLSTIDRRHVLTPWSGYKPIRQRLPEDTRTADELHAALFEDNCYPSARTCQACHPGHFREWSVSPHAYAQLSPVFNAMHTAVVKLTNGTFGDFCIRCHTPVGMDRNEPLGGSNLDRHPVSREGITCIVCHRINERHGKNSGRSSFLRGDIFAPVLGPKGNRELQRVLDNEGGRFGNLATNPGDTKRARSIHRKAEPFFYLSEPGFCGTCHDVTLGNGFRLEEAFSEYKHSPAALKGQTCQDCHMGVEHGRVSGYRCEPAAIVNGVPTAPRKRTNHMFPGPDHSIIHPGLFPHLGAQDARFATPREWLKFDHEAGWGTEAFELAVEQGTRHVKFPKVWQETMKRREARAILKGQFELLSEYREAQWLVLREGYRLGRVVVDHVGSGGIDFRVCVSNGTDGHNVPTGFIAERTLFLEVTVRDGRGNVVFRSGDLDPNGDVRDLHSTYVHDGLIPKDPYLFSLQSKFITRMLRGGEREQVLAINHSLDPLPFLRPARNSTILSGGPGGARIHRVGIAPLGKRWAKYHVEPRCMTCGPYTARIRMIAGMVPLNLIKAIHKVGFDYGMSARDVGDRIVAGRQVLWDRTVTLQPGAGR